MPSNFKVDFSKRTNYNPNSNVESVVWGAGGPIMEVDINEAQSIQINRLQNLVRAVVGDGLIGGNVEYKDSTLTITDADVVIDGKILNVDTISLAMQNGDSAYIKVWTEDVLQDSVIYKDGNVQSETLPNYIVDSRYGVEVTRRTQTLFDLVSDNSDENCVYLKIGTITDNAFTKEFVSITKNSEAGRGGTISDEISAKIDEDGDLVFEIEVK